MGVLEGVVLGLDILIFLLMTQMKTEMMCLTLAYVLSLGAIINTWMMGSGLKRSDEMIS